MVTKSKSATRWGRRSRPSDDAFNPHPYQKRAIKHLLDNPHAALFLDPGLGKTAITLAGLKVLEKQGMFNGALVVAPLRVAYSVWPAEVKRWKDFRHFSVGILHGPKKDRVAEEKHDIYVINYEGLAWLIESGTLDRMVRARQIDVLVFDELSKMKNPAAKRFRAMRKHLHKFRRRIGLTGSPAPNGVMDLFGQMFMLDRGARLGQYITHFRHTYFLPKGPYDWKPKPGTHEAIQEKIQDIALSMRAEDYLDLPPMLEVDVPVELPAKARRVYREVEKELLTSLDSGATLTASSAATALSKCKQIANGAVYLGDVDPITGVSLGEKKWEHLHDAKIDALLDLIDELQGQPLLVAYEFRHDLERLLKVLPKGTPHIGGGTRAQDAADIERRWNAGEIQVLLGHPQSIGHGLNLQHSGAGNVAWLSPTWNYELYDQFNRRLWRQGSKADRVILHRIVARDTVDEDVLWALRHKGRVQDNLMEALKNRLGR